MADYIFEVDPKIGINTLDAKTNVLMQIRMLLRHKDNPGVTSYGQCGNNNSPLVYVTCTEAAKDVLLKELKGIIGVSNRNGAPIPRPPGF